MFSPWITKSFLNRLHPKNITHWKICKFSEKNVNFIEKSTQKINQISIYVTLKDVVICQRYHSKWIFTVNVHLFWIRNIDKYERFNCCKLMDPHIKMNTINVSFVIVAWKSRPFDDLGFFFFYGYCICEKIVYNFTEKYFKLPPHWISTS